MKAQELRIGNYVQQKITQAPLKIKSIDPDSLFWFGLEPIPLTEEWLIKLGFEKNGLKMGGSEWYEFKRPYIGWGDYRICNRYENEWAFTLECVMPATNAISTIHYVHQLQNLFFALAGEELTIK